MRQAVDAPVRLRRVGQAALGEVGEVEIRIHQRLVGHQRPHVVHPLVLAELALLHVIGKLDHVEARAAGIELDDGLLPLLLLGNHFGADGDARHVLEFLVVLGEQVAARALDQEDLDRLALEFLPVERRLRVCRELARRRAWRRAPARRHLPAAAGGAGVPEFFEIVTICHDCLLACGRMIERA